jgi:hypothetical protein
MGRPDRFWPTALCLAGSVLLAGGLAACVNEDPAPVVVEIDYQVRCLSCEPRAPDEPPHDIHAVLGRMGFRVSCTRDQFGDARVLSFAADTNERQVNGSEGFSVAIRQAVPGPDPGPTCRVNAREGVNKYEGRCGADEPTDEVPCQVTMDVDDGVLVGTLLCRNISDEGGAQRSIVASESDEPAEFKVHGCPGL